ncbi:MAG: glycosyltransferase family 9 protein [Gemmatimonadetes bacterium]|uniref:Glycosyltransferase family 9 protein n=1 Tax=Candidatus Kutchimonas denitrificans TaxID=3056748 RepID=A0AAE4Z8H5_9BACT|nr:glycosyltransferase family 9 protein [Gemmatimonadota bacterium]NIR74938.1 glycosyltransferase family 9 protein [Candidatus Kutchimonas denitrificans]NIS00050.1 glycosyltransferase family 9 protein [Gemmatimonadota bacterium]NIT65633.1 glycosyltransferase family 9 protein [Gemmatimonadota bacterium]NIU52603.1 hypothetical protein [Gemmatimonadota bacterium]
MSGVLEAGKRICMVLLSGIGDVVHGLPIVNALERDDPERRITWIVESLGALLLRPHPAIDEVITFDRRRGLTAVTGLWRALRRLEFDTVINFNVYFKAIVPTAIARAPDKLAFGRDRARDLVWLFANHRLPARQTRHTQDRFLEFLAYLGIETEPIEWRIQLTEEEREAQSEFFRALAGRPTVGLVPTSGRPLKDWPVERFAETATALERDFGFEVVLLGGPGARETERARAVAESSEAAPRWALGNDLRRLVYLIDGLDLLIAPDTGPVHIARALGTPVIGLYGHTDPHEVGPYRAYEDLWIDRSRDEPERHAPGGWDQRMELIAVSDVLDRVERALERYVRPRAESGGA